MNVVGDLGTIARRPTAPVVAAGTTIVLALLAQAAVALLSDVVARPLVLDAVNAVVLAIAGAVLWRRAPTATGPMLVLAGAALGLNNLVYVEAAPLLRTAGAVAVPAFVVPLCCALLAFPGGRLRRADGVLLVAATLVSTVLWWVVLAAYAPAPGCTACGLPDLLPDGTDRGRFETLFRAHGLLSGALGLAVAVTLVRRWRRSSPAARRVRAPVMVAGALTCVVVAAAAPFGLPVLDGRATAAPAALAWAFGLAAVPLAMLLSLLRQRTAGVPLPELLRALDRAPADGSVRDALAGALGDPTLEVVHRVPGRPGWWTTAEARADLEGGARHVTPLGGPTARTGMLHDVALLEEPALLDTVARAAALAFEHERARERLRLQLEEARAVRARIVAASDEARRRIERDLHDGAQQTLVSLVLALGMLAEELEDDGDDLARRLVRHATDQADRALDELRDLARGVFPALLVNDGLRPALEELARRCPLPVALELDVPVRHEPPVEAAAWFLVREGLHNAARHAEASRCTLRARFTGGVLEVEVVDDGRGGARAVPGGGLAQLADRVAALGGSLELERRREGGTRLAARLPTTARPPGPPAASAPTAVPSG